ncbi:hypothetical protein FBU30_004681 [Linnemannia zychae]|nr:hypothetical protein FBU30_004681 [Linnemannia zychae]
MTQSEETNLKVIRWGLSGFGPRHALYLIHQAMIILAYEEKIKSLGIDFILNYTVFEKQDIYGVGNAFKIYCDATANTPVKTPLDFLGDDVKFGLNSPLDSQGNNILLKLMGFAELGSATSRVQIDDHNTILAELKKRNPAAVDLFQKAFQTDGRLSASVASITRGKWGHIQLENIHNALNYIRDNVPKIRIDIKYLHEVVNVNFADPLKPGLLVKHVGSSDSGQEYVFDFVSFAHGTPLISVLNPDVAPKAYSHTPNHDTLREYLRKCGVLDANNKIIPGKNIACTGLGLSFYDYASLLLAFLPGIENSSDPVDFIKSIADKYPGLITAISRSGRPAPPRTVLESDWCGKKPSFFSAQEMHALRLQKDANWLPIAYEFLEAHIAWEKQTVPSKVKFRTSTTKYMESYLEDNTKYLEGDRTTESGLLRAGYTAFTIGTGLETNIEQAEETLIGKAPHTRKGRLGLPMFSASGYEMSSVRNFDTDENTKFFKYWEDQILFNYASPVPIQNIMATLFTSGIARHQKGTFDQIGILRDEDKMTFKLEDSTFDALLAPKRIDRSGDPILEAVKRKVKEIKLVTTNESTLQSLEDICIPDYGKGGYFQTPGIEGEDPKPINAFDAGMGGGGTKVGSRTAGAQWNGLTNNHYASAVFATQHAYHTLALAIAYCQHTSKSPIEVVTKIYNDILPNKNLFEGEVNSFSDDWNELREKQIFLRIAKKHAGINADLYKDFIDNISTNEKREACLSKHRIAKSNCDYDEVGLMEGEYRPPTCEEYEKRFADYTKVQYKEILNAIFNRTLLSEGPRGDAMAYRKRAKKPAEFDRNYSFIF